MEQQIKRSFNTLLDKVSVIKFEEYGDQRGKLIAIESKSEIPFEIKRIFYIFGMNKTMVRGQHANRNSEFVLININGNSKVRVRDGFNEKVYELSQPSMGLYLPAMTWKDMYDFSSDSILLVLSNEYYDEDEYIRDYDEFLKVVRGEA